MLFLLCEAGGHHLGIDVRSVVAVLPRVRFQTVPGAPPWLAGLFAYNGRPTPVVDVPFLVGGEPCPVRWSSRIVLVSVPGESAVEPQRFGLLMERVETAQLTASPEELPRTTVDVPSWGPVVLHEGELVQFLDLPRLLAQDRPLALIPGIAATEDA
jgi:chemotaxis-related protein WspB